MKKQYGILQALRVAMHPAKTFIGKVKKGFDFLGFHLTPTGVTVSKAALSRHEQKVARLYEQDAKPKRIRSYRLRWLVWALIAPGAAQGDVSIPARDGLPAMSPSVNVNSVYVQDLAPGVSTRNGSPTSRWYINPSSSTTDFNLRLPGSAYASTTTTAAKLNVENTADSDLLPAVTSTCVGAQSAVPVAATFSFDVVLANGTSCPLNVFWDNSGDPISFTGATLSRAADGVYSIDGNGVIRGEDAGGTANTPTATATPTQNIPIFGPFGLLAMIGGMLWFGSRRRNS